MPGNTYYAKKLISLLTMGVEKIHACTNHCILYCADDYKDLESCPKCGASWYKTNKDYREEECAAFGKKRKKTQKNNRHSSKPSSKEKDVDYYAQKKILALVMWYLPIVDRLRCLFTNLEDVQLCEPPPPPSQAKSVPNPPSSSAQSLPIPPSLPSSLILPPLDPPSSPTPVSSPLESFNYPASPPCKDSKQTTPPPKQPKKKFSVPKLVSPFEPKKKSAGVTPIS